MKGSEGGRVDQTNWFHCLPRRCGGNKECGWLALMVGVYFHYVYEIHPPPFSGFKSHFSSCLISLSVLKQTVASGRLRTVHHVGRRRKKTLVLL